MSIVDRIDAVTKIDACYMKAVLPAPKSVKIELTGRCNYRCGFCALRTREVQPKSDMPIEFFRRITTEMSEAGVEEIGVFYLGESFMAPDLLVQAVKWCKHILRIPYVFLTSNASMAGPETVEELMEAGLDSLKWSVNAADEEQFERVMGVKASLFHDAMENIREAFYVRKRGKFTTGLSASSIHYDGEQNAKMRQLLEEKVIPYVDTHYWLPLYSMGSFATKREAELGYRPTAGNQGRLANLRDPLPCWSAFTEGHVTADGKLSACCFDANSNWTMADLKDVGFMDGWNSAKFTALREAHLRKDVKGTVCEDCIAY